MTSRRYVLVVLMGVLLGVVAAVGSSVALDHFALFRNPRATPRKVYGSERTAKYLLAKRYVPANFDSLMIGGSISSNWNTGLIATHRVYNASLSGGNLSEERLIAEPVLERGRLQWLIFCLHPYLTMTRGRKTGYMTPQEEWGALGSLDLFILEGTKIAVDLGLKTDRHNEFGDSNYFNNAPRARELTERYIVERRRSGRSHPNFTVAPGALDDLRELVGMARERGVRLAVVYPPVYKPRFDAEREDWERYWSRVEVIFPSGTHYLNFNAPEFDAERSDFANFQDGAHLSRDYADSLVRRLGVALTD